MVTFWDIVNFVEVIFPSNVEGTETGVNWVRKKFLAQAEDYMLCHPSNARLSVAMQYYDLVISFMSKRSLSFQFIAQINQLALITSRRDYFIRFE